jgi:hypothetical protein
MARSSRELNHRGSSLHELLHRVRDASGGQLNVRFGSKADVTLLNFDVRFTAESGHCGARLAFVSFDCASSAATTHQCIVDQQHHDRSHNCDDHAVDIQAGNARCPKQVK